MAELKTKKNEASVEKFLNAIKDGQTRKDCFEIAKMMQQSTKAAPKMWGASIVGFGEYHYKYASGREGDWMLTGFSPRKQNMTVYLISGFAPFAKAMPKLGKHKTSAGSCLTFRSLADLHLPTLRKIVKESAALMRKRSVDQK